MTDLPDDWEGKYVALDDNGAVTGFSQHPEPAMGHVIPMALDHPALLAYMNPSPERRKVSKDVIVARLAKTGKIGAAKAALESDPYAWARWVSGKHTEIYFDDADAIALLTAIDADVGYIMGEGEEV